MKNVAKTLFACGVAVLGMTTASAVTLTINPNSQMVAIGGQATYEIVVSDLGTVKLTAFDAQVDFDALLAAALSASSVTGWGNEFTDISVAGQVYIADTSPDSGTFLTGTGSHVLGKFTLEGLASGTIPLDFNQAFTSLTEDDGLTTLSVSFSAAGGSLQVPDAGATAGMLGLGLFGLGFMRTRFSKR